MAKKNRRCAKCSIQDNLTRHHIYPKRHFRGSNSFLILCRDCHDEIEKLIPYEKQPKSFYKEIVERFLKEE